MSRHTILITGGAGFIGSHVTDELIKHGYSVRILDNLCEQVHGPAAAIPSYLNTQAEFIRGDIANRRVLAEAIQGIHAVIHLAAAVGVGQSMYEIEKYMRVNSLGTAVLLEALVAHPPERLVVASSMSIYGEGLYCTELNVCDGSAQRQQRHLRAGLWEIMDPFGAPMAPRPTPETKPPRLNSIYALSKYDQEQMALSIGRTYGIPTVALRLFNVYGPRQALSNPYTGVLANFAARYLNDKPPLIFEDGLQQRDFVSVYDVARAFRLAVESDAADVVLNIGSGRHDTIVDVAKKLAHLMGKEHIAPVITGKYRAGDIRHCFADIRRAQEVLGFAPGVAFSDGLAEFCEWLARQQAADRLEQAHAELSERGLAV